MNDLWLSKDFELSEFECRCGCVMPPGYIDGLREFVQTILQPHFRDKLGPVRITSGYRCPSHNAAIGGAPRSYHLYDRSIAVDFKVYGYSGHWLAGYADALQRTKLKDRTVIPAGGIGVYANYPDMIHLDDRGRMARWGK